MKRLGGNKIFKRASLGLLAAFSLIAAGFAAFSFTRESARPTQEVGAAASSSAIVLNSSSTLSPSLSGNYTYAYHTVSGVSATQFWLNYCKKKTGAFCQASILNNGFVGNTEALDEHYYSISVTAKLSGTYNYMSTYPTYLLVKGATSFSTDPYNEYSNLYTSVALTTSYQTFTINSSSVVSDTYFIVGSYCYYWSSLPDVIISNITFNYRTLTSITLDGADSIGFANEGTVYDYAVTGHYSDGSTADITKLATVTSSLVNTMKLGVQTMSVSYGGFTASKDVRVTNVNAVVGKTIPAAIYTDASFTNVNGLTTTASLDGKTVNFSTPGTLTTGSWDIAATPRYSGDEYNNFGSDGYWQIGAAGSSYTTVTFTSRDIWVNMTRFEFYAYGSSSYWTSFSGSVEGYIGSWHMTAIDLPTAATKIYENLATNPQTGHISLTFTINSDRPFFMSNFQITTEGGTAQYFTPTEQANATRDFIQQYKTCPGGVSDEVVARCALEYNAMDVTLTEGGSTGKAIFKALTETVNDYDYSDASQYLNGSYTGGTASLAGVKIYDKLTTMVKWYNKNHSTKIYLYDDSTYTLTDNNGTNGYLPVFIDQAGHIVTPTSTVSATSMTLIIVAASGVLTLLAIAGIYLVSKKKKARKE
ncbi:MAG: hypothetical protein BWY98_00249 [Tenericutes bacterium ADurb.BinA155]|nr:MAG: hypothetical protein BWY98_00249 [Tenericutes bacterium ADurb.BinA155]